MTISPARSIPFAACQLSWGHQFIKSHPIDKYVKNVRFLSLPVILLTDLYPKIKKDIPTPKDNDSSMPKATISGSWAGVGVGVIGFNGQRILLRKIAGIANINVVRIIFFLIFNVKISYLGNLKKAMYHPPLPSFCLGDLES